MMALITTVMVMICYIDADGDGFLSLAGTVESDDLDCLDAGPGSISAPMTDCDDTDANTYDGATEIDDGIDNDCDV